MKKLLSILFSIFALTAISQNTLKPVTWNAIYVPISSSEGEIHFMATIEKKWHIYSQRPTDVGPIPTSFSLTPSSEFELIGKVEEGEAHEEYVAAFDAKVFVFSDKAVFKQKVKLKNQKSFAIKASLEFMTCNDIQCLPPTILSFDVIVHDSKAQK